MKRLLIVGYVWPEPNSSAAGTRMLQLIEFFRAQQYQVVFASAAQLSPHRFDLSAIDVEEKSIALNCSSFDDYVRELQPQLVLFDRFFTEEQFGWRVEQACPQAVRLLDTEDLHSLRALRQHLLKQTQQQLPRGQVAGPVLATAADLYPLLCDSDIAQRELAAIYRCDLSLMISDYEITLLRDYFQVPEALLCYCPLQLTGAPAPENLPGFAVRQGFISIGNFRHEPNWDAVLWLKEQLWPAIRAQLPQAELHIYGAYPPPKATQLHNPRQGFMVKGWAESAAQVMQQARVCLAPLRFGAGIKGKLLDAMSQGTPSVTTSIGAEAMAGDYPWPGAVADDVDSMVAAALRLYTGESHWREAQQAAAVLLQARYGSNQISTHLHTRLTQLCANLERERQQNFIGKMLRHQYHQSLRFKSLWIEAKNRSH